MAYKLILPPQQSSYAVTDGNEVGMVQLDGGMGRYRRAIIGATSTVNVSWKVGVKGFEYIRAFYKTAVNEGSRRFLVDLVLDKKTPEEHEAMFIPESMSASSMTGNKIVVSAQLEVIPLPRNADNDSMFIAAVEAFGLDDWERYADMLDQVLLDMPT